MLDNYDDYKTGGTHKVFSISVVGENITITNENLRTESIVLDEELCSSTNLKFGSCGTSKFTAEIANVFENFEGKLINVTVTMDNEVTKYGTFKVFSDKPIADRIFRSLTAYDAMNDIIKTNVLSWYKSLTFPMTLKNFRDSFFNYLGITQETTTLVNDNFIIPGGFTASDSLMGGTIITAICELNGVFGHINRDGKFEYIDLTQSESFECPPYENGSVTYEDYVTSPITKVTMRGTASDVGTSVGVAGNEYIIQGNPLIYGTEGTQALTTAITNLLNKIKNIVFRPFDLRKTIGNPCVEIGDAITIDTKYETITSYVLRRTLTGIQALRDRYSASGSRVYPAVATSYSNEITRTQGKIHEVEVSLDEFRSEVSQTYVTQSAYNSKIQELQDEIDGAIESFTGSAVPTLNNYPASDWTTTTEKDKHIGDLYQVNSQGGSYAGFYYRFDKTNNVYSWVHIPDNEVQKALADAAEANRKAEAAQNTADGIATDLSTNYSTTQQMNSAINQKAEEIELAVSQTYATQQTVTNVKNSTIKSDVLHYLATSAGSGVTRSTPGWTTTIQSMTETNQYLWTYHTYTYGDDHTSDTDPIITGRYGQNGSQGPQGPTGPQGPQGSQGNPGDDGISIVEVIPLKYAGNSTTAPTAPTSNVTRTDAATGVWTRGVPALTNTYKYMYTCDQVKYSNNTYTWTSVVLDNAITNLTQRMTQAELDLQPDSITAKVSSTNTFTTIDQFNSLEIGGRNLVRNTADFKDCVIGNVDITLKTNEDIVYVSTTPSSVSWGTQVAVKPNVPIEYIKDKSITISADVRLKTQTSSTSSAFLYVIEGYASVSTTTCVGWIELYFAPDRLEYNKWVRVSINKSIVDSEWHFESGKTISDVKYFTLKVYNHSTFSADFRHFKVEAGTKATDWSPAPEDLTNYTDQKVDGLEIGSVNLVDNKYKYGINNWGHDTATITVINDSTYYKTLNVTIIGGALRIYAGVDNVWKANQKYTVSFMAKSSDSGVTLRASRSLADVSERTEALTSDWKLYTLHLVSTTTVDGGTLSIDANKNCTFQITNIKLEKGDKATSFNLSTSDTNGIAQMYASDAETTAKSYTDAQLQITSSSILSTVEQGYTTKTDFNNLSIGGENILMQTNSGTTGWSQTVGSKWKAPTLESITWLGRDALKVTGNGVNDASSSSSWHVLMFLPTGGFAQYLIPDTEYTISFDSTFKHTRCQFQQANGQGAALTGYISLDSISKTDQSGNTYWHHTGIGKTKTDFTGVDPYWTRVYFDTVTYFETAESVAKYANLKIEEGNKATDWSPSPVEMSSKSEVQQLSNMVAVKVNSSGRLVTVALGVDPASSTSYFKVKADDIDIISNGNIQLTSKSIGITSTNFSVTAAGLLTCTGANVKGDIITDSLKIDNKANLSIETALATYTSFTLSSDFAANPYGTLSSAVQSNRLLLASGYGLNIPSDVYLGGYTRMNDNALVVKDFQVNQNFLAVGNGCIGGWFRAGGNIMSDGEGVFGTGIELGMKSNDAAAFIDFHWNSTNTDWTARIVQRAESTVDLIGKNSSTWGIWRAASFNSQSSKYVKKNIKDVTEKEAKNILKLRPVKFDYKNSDITNQRGLIAEEVLEIMPEMVNVPKDYTGFNKDEPWNTPSIDYSKFVPYLIKMIQILQMEIDDLKK